MSREVSLELRVLGLDQRLAALEQQVVTLIAAITRVRPGSPEVLPRDRDSGVIFGPGKPYEKKLVGIDEAGAVMAEDREALAKVIARNTIIARDEIRQEALNEPDSVQDET